VVQAFGLTFGRCRHSRCAPLRSNSLSGMSNPLSDATPAALAAEGLLQQPAQQSFEDRISRLQGVLDSYEITIGQADELTILRDYQIVVLADDSESMLKSAQPPGARSLVDVGTSRWQELSQVCSQLVELACCLGEHGVDIHFLHRDPLLGVASARDQRFAESFARNPDGKNTPLVEKLQHIASSASNERKILLILMTDGEPDGGRDAFTAAVSRIVARGNIKIQIMMCTPDVRELGWLNNLDRSSVSVDVTDDFYVEKAEALRTGRMSFSRGDWLLKAMLGPVSARFDAMDEQKKCKCCCTIS